MMSRSVLLRVAYGSRRFLALSLEPRDVDAPGVGEEIAFLGDLLLDGVDIVGGLGLRRRRGVGVENSKEDGSSSFIIMSSEASFSESRVRSIITVGSDSLEGLRFTRAREGVALGVGGSVVAFGDSRCCSSTGDTTTGCAIGGAETRRGVVGDRGGEGMRVGEGITGVSSTS